MRSVGIPQVESEDTGAPIPEPVSSSKSPSYLPIVVIVALGAGLIYLLSSLGDFSSAVEEPVSPAGPATTVASTTIAPDIAELPDQAPTGLLSLGGGVHIALDEFDEAPIVSAVTGFERIVPIDGQRTLLTSETGAVWNSETASTNAEFENGRISGIDVSPNYEVDVVAFRSVDGVVVSVGSEQVEKIPILHEAELVDFVVGNDTAYLTLRDPTNDPLTPRFVVLRVTYGDEFGVRGINPRNELGDGFERLRNGTVLQDGRIIAIATNRTNTVAKLVEFRSDEVVDVELDEASTNLLLEAVALHAHGNDLVLVDSDGNVYVKSPDSPTFSESTMRVHPTLSASRGGVLVSVSLEAAATIVRTWMPGSSDSTEVTLQGRIEPLEMVSMNSTEALLRTRPPNGQGWLINVPFPTE